MKTVYVDRYIREGPSAQYLVPIEPREEPITYEDYIDAYWGHNGYKSVVDICNARLTAIASEYNDGRPTE